MGCGGSKSGGKKERVDMTMDPTGNGDLDALFSNMTGPLSTLADVANSLKKGENKLKRRTHAYLLTGCTLDDSIKAMLYELSASTNGDFDKIELKVVAESPYIKISKHHIAHEYHEVVDAWNYLADKLVDAGKALLELPGQIMGLVEEAKGIQDRAKAICENAGMNMLEMAKCIRAVASNVGKILKAPSVLEEAKKRLESVLKVCVGLEKTLDHEGREKIHHVGKEIHKAGCKNLRDMIVNHWPEKVRVDVKLERPRKAKTQPHH